MGTNTFSKLPEDRQTEILDAATHVIAQKGFFQAGINEICQAAGISNGALYKYFGSKKGLYITVARRTLELTTTKADQILSLEMDIWERLRHLLEEILTFTTEFRDYFIIYMDLSSPSMDPLAAELTNAFEQMSFKFYRQLILGAREKKEIRKEVSTETAAYLIDNHLMLFAFSCVSEHYDRRFNQFFNKKTGCLSSEEKMEITMLSFRQLL